MGLGERIKDAVEDGQVWLESRMLTAANPLFFMLRRKVAFGRSGYAEGPHSDSQPTPDFAKWMTSPAAAQLIHRYELEDFRARMSPGSFASMVRFSDLLSGALDGARHGTSETGNSQTGNSGAAAAIEALRIDDPSEEHQPGTASEPLRVLDIGSKNFEAAPAIHRVLRRETGGRPVRLTGIEIDAHRVYRSLHSRADVARYYLSLIPEPRPGHRYLAADFLTHTDSYDVITWFKPFLTDYAHLRWGLPAHLLRPEPMIRHLLDRLSPNGLAIIVNQNDHEAEIQRGLLSNAGATFTSTIQPDASQPSDRPVHVHIVRPPKNPPITGSE